DNSASSSTKQDDTLADIDPLETIAESSPKQEIKTEGMESEVNKSEVEKSADDIALADDVPKRGATDDTDNEADDLKSEEIVQTKESKNDTDDETNKEKEELNEDDSGGKDVEKDDGQNETETNEDNEKPSDHDRGENENEEKVYESEKLDPVVEEEKKSNEAEILPQEEEPPREKTPEPEPIKITRNIDIDNAVTVIEDTEGSLKDLLNDMKELLTNYQDRVNSQSLSDFTNDLDKFRGDFESLKDAFKYSEELFHYLNKTLKDLRMLGDNMNSLIQKKFRMEDLTVWLESPEERLEEKEKLKEERIAVEKSAMAKAAEARAAIARAAVGVTESSLYAAEVEAEAAEAEGVAMRAWESAQNARRDMEEAEKAAVEKRKAEEEARKRAEERAQKKAEEERLRQEEENKRLQEEAEKKGTSFEDEKRQFLEEKARKEEARKNPKNWPRYIYSIESANLDQGVPGCVIRAIEGSMTRDDVTVTAVDQLSGTLTLVENEELISNIILIKSTDPEKKFQFEEPVAVAIPHCLQRNIPGREPVIKQLQPNGRWAELPTNDVIIEDIRELKFVEIRTRRFGVFAVVLRLKKDTLAFMRRGNKVNSTVDARITFTCKPGTFKNNVCFTSEVQTLDVNTVTDLNKRYPTECGSLLSSSPILRFQIPNRKFAKPLTLTLPLPPNTVKQKRPQSVAPGSLNREKMDQREQAPARPVSSMGFTPKEDEPEEESHLIVRDDKGPWMVLPKVNLVQPKNKDIVTFDIKEPHDRFILVKTKQGVSPLSIEKIANHVEKAIHHRTMHVILRQRSDDPNEIVMMCCPASKTEKIIKKLGEEGFDEGPPPSKDIIVKEGQILTVGFRGNIQCDNDDDIKMVFNTFIRGRKEFSVEEIDKFAQKSFPFYRGFAQVFTKVMVQRPVVAADKAKAPQKPGAMEWVEEDVLLTELLINIPKPEPEPPKPLATAPIRVSAEGPNKEDVLQFVAGELGDEWKKLAQYLCLKSVRIQAILRQNNQNPDPKKIRYDMLVTWAKRVPRCLNKLEILAQALNACGRGDLAAELRDRDEEFRRRRALAFRDSYLRRAFVKVAQNPEAVKGWKTIASRLGVSSDDVNEIDQSAPSIQQKCFSSLQRWQKSVGDEATLPILSEKLRVCKYRQLARDIETIS
ncbi:death domain-containing protein 1-like, partial [Saccostrea cucullata]|uniref:death domain-containing protein 1-like n=1 Tax=Saccostrea cuccullata TaxID=36930 RepID=UPI002ED53B3F